MGKWVLIKGSEYIGPFTGEAVKSMYESGLLNLNSVLWSEEYDRRDKLSAFDIFNDTLPNVPPPVGPKYKKEAVGAIARPCPYCKKAVKYQDYVCSHCGYVIIKKDGKTTTSDKNGNRPRGASASSKKRSSSNYVIIAVVIAVILFLVVVSLSITSEPEEPPLPLPRSGVMSTNYSSASAVAPFEMISKRGSDNFYIKIYHYGTERLAASVFLRAGERIEFDVPLGSYELRWATGKDWYGQTKHFGPKTNYYKANDVFRFRDTGEYIEYWVVEFDGTTSGNLERIPIDNEDF